MVDLDKVYEGMYACEPNKQNRKCKECPYQDEQNCDVVLYNDCLTAICHAKSEIREENIKLFAENHQLRKELERERAYNYALVTVIGRYKED